MNECSSVAFKNSGKLCDVRLDDVNFSMNQGVKTEDEVNRVVGDHIEGFAIVEDEFKVLVECEALAAFLDAVGVQIYADQVIALIFQELGPSPIARRNFQYGSCGQKFFYARQNSSRPLFFRAAPTIGPFVAAARPRMIVSPVSYVFFNRWH